MPSLDCQVAADKQEISFRFNTKVYEKEAVYGAGLVFSNRCFVYLEGDKDSDLTLTLQSKAPIDEKGLLQLAGDFHNELLNQTLRWMVARENRNLREAILHKALTSSLPGAGTVPPPPAPVPQPQPAPEPARPRADKAPRRAGRGTVRA